MTDNSYICEICGGEFEKTWPDEDALKETAEIFGDELAKLDLSIVCDDCWKKIMKSQN